MPSSNVNFDVTDAFLVVFPSLVHNRNERSKAAERWGKTTIWHSKFCLLILFIFHFPILGSLFYSIHYMTCPSARIKKDTSQYVYISFFIIKAGREINVSLFDIQRRVFLMFLMWHVYKRSTFLFFKDRWIELRAQRVKRFLDFYCQRRNYVIPTSPVFPLKTLNEKWILMNKMGCLVCKLMKNTQPYAEPMYLFIHLCNRDNNL